MIRLLFLLATVWLAARLQSGRLPGSEAMHPALAADPVQTETIRTPFAATVGKETYYVEPLAEYEVWGLVVGANRADRFLNTTHRSLRDEINPRDLGLIWGDNVRNGLHRELSFRSDDFTQFVEARTGEVWSRFRENQFANHHLAASSLSIRDRIRSFRVGDQVHLRGFLCRYTDSNGVTRDTSLTRDDTGNGACEVVWVESIEVLAEGNAGWRALGRISGWLWFGAAGLTLLSMGSGRGSRSAAPPVSSSTADWLRRGDLRG